MYTLNIHDPICWTCRRWRRHHNAAGGIDYIQRVRGRELAAFERLYRLYQPRLTRFLSNLVQRSQVLEEVVDDTMMVVWDTAGNFRGASKLSASIFSIAYRKALKARPAGPIRSRMIRTIPAPARSRDRTIRSSMIAFTRP